MKILLIGTQENFEEFKNKFGEEHEYLPVEEAERADVIFDFTIDENSETFEYYLSIPNTLVVLNTAKISLAELVYLYGKPKTNHIFGFNGLPTFIDREVVEVSSLGYGYGLLEKNMRILETAWHPVRDRVGLVTPRIIFMIINEAYYTLQEGTASREAVDKAMKLGTNYPYGPFEWAEKIGINHVYETLEAIYEDTRDERYKICSLLKHEYLLTTTAY